MALAGLTPRRSPFSPCLRPDLVEKLRPEKRALANGQCVHRPRTCFPEVRRCNIEERDARQVESVKALAERLSLGPSPRSLGVDVNPMEFSFDRGTMCVVEAPYEETSRVAW